MIKISGDRVFSGVRIHTSQHFLIEVLMTLSQSKTSYQNILQHQGIHISDIFQMFRLILIADDELNYQHGDYGNVLADRKRDARNMSQGQ